MNEKHSLLAGLTCLADAKTRSISPENFHGEKGKGGMAVEGTGKECARELGQGWKISPSVEIPGKETLLLADIQGSGIIQHIWLTCPHEDWRSLVLRFYWDAEETPSIEVPLGDFFCMGWCETGLLQSLPVCVNPSGGMNCYWQMPFLPYAGPGRRTISAAPGTSNIQYENTAVSPHLIPGCIRLSGPTACIAPSSVLACTVFI